MSAPQTPAARKHGFTLCLLGVIALAWLFPQPGTEGGFLRPEWTTKFGVWVIFLLQGVSLPTRELAAGYRPLRLQGFVLGWNYLLFPAVTFVCLLGLAPFLSSDLALGFGLLSILPTTIASAVAFTDLAGGRTSSAVCATVLSNLLAIALVPLWVALYLRAGASVSLPLAPLLSKLALLIFLPLLLGQGLRLFWKALPGMVSAWTRPVSSAIILFIVYTAFAQSVASGFYEAMSLSGLAFVLLGALVLLALVSGLVWQSARCFQLTPGERVAAFFCASQKSLATGLPLAAAIFAALPETLEIHTGAVLLPLIVYHPLQLVLAAVWAERAR